MKATVAIVRCEDYEPAKVFRAVKEAVDLLGGMEAFVSQGASALLKPNLLSIKPPESAVCTHPAVVEAVTSLVQAAGAHPAVGDSPSIGAESPDGYKRLLDVSGMRDVIGRTGASVVRFDDSATEREAPDAKVYRRFLIADAVTDADVLINVPKLKTHGLTVISCAVKNLFGCVTARRKVEYHLGAGNDPAMFAQVIADLGTLVRPKLSIMDAVVGMDGQGPVAGRRRNFGLILASADPVALDTVVCALGGLNPMDVPTLRLAAEQGIGCADLAEIDVRGMPIEDARIPDFMLPGGGDLASKVPKPVFRALRNQLLMRPVFIPDACAACGLCAETCPVDAISGEGTRLRVDYSKCIRCYCCQEVCPHEAIELRSSRLRSFVEVSLHGFRKIRAFLRGVTSGRGRGV